MQRAEQFVKVLADFLELRLRGMLLFLQLFTNRFITANSPGASRSCRYAEIRSRSVSSPTALPVCKASFVSGAAGIIKINQPFAIKRRESSNAEVSVKRSYCDRR